jgi:hypothetical protein
MRQDSRTIYPPRKEQPMDDFFSFKTMLTPVIIRILFWVGIFASIIGGIYLIVISHSSAGFHGVASLHSAGIISGIFCIIVVPLVWRLICELMILQFRIYETLIDINQTLTFIDIHQEQHSAQAT